MERGFLDAGSPVPLPFYICMLLFCNDHHHHNMSHFNSPSVDTTEAEADRSPPGLQYPRARG